MFLYQQNTLGNSAGITNNMAAISTDAVESLTVDFLKEKAQAYFTYLYYFIFIFIVRHV